MERAPKVKKRYYAAMKMRTHYDVTDYFGDVHRLSVVEKNTGIVGLIPVFTNKKKAKRWGKVVEIELLEGEK